MNSNALRRDCEKNCDMDHSCLRCKHGTKTNFIENDPMRVSIRLESARNEDRSND